MCLILLACGVHPDYPLVIAANRDEYYHRRTAPAAYWPDCRDILAGRDLECRGTWLGVTRTGRFAALTNFRAPGEHKPEAPSRGNLVSSYLAGDLGAIAYLESIKGQASRYNGFNLLVGDGSGIYYFCSRDLTPREVPRGVHGLSNHVLDTPWPKVVRGKQRLQQALSNTFSAETLLGILQDKLPADDADLPDTGVGMERERVLSPVLIVSPEYGTRASTIVLYGREGQVSFTERTVLQGGMPGATVSRSFRLANGLGA